MTDVAPEIPEPAGTFYSNIGPHDGPIMFGEAPVMGVLSNRDGRGFPIGIAWLSGPIPSRKGPVQLWRLEVNKVKLEGVWICRNRQFIRLGDAAEEV